MFDEGCHRLYKQTLSALAQKYKSDQRHWNEHKKPHSPVYRHLADGHNKLVLNILDPLSDGSNGVYTIAFFNITGSAITTSPYSGIGGSSNTWIYATSYRDYLITATVGSVSVHAQIRQVPGFSEPPALGGTSPNFTYTWSTGNVSFIDNKVYPYTWLSP